MNTKIYKVMEKCKNGTRFVVFSGTAEECEDWLAFNTDYDFEKKANVGLLDRHKTYHVEKVNL